MSQATADPPKVDRQAADAAFEAVPTWWTGGQRHWEASETTRLNKAHWQYATDEPINVWLMSQLPTLRTRSIYESRQNGMLQGMQNTHADDIVGIDGPKLEVESDSLLYSTALEDIWREWFRSPTPKPNVSGAVLLKLWVRNLWRCGEFLAVHRTVPRSGAVWLKLQPVHPRRLETPSTLAGDENIVMGIRFDRFSRPARYYVRKQRAMGVGYDTGEVDVYPPDLVVHEFLMEEEDQARGVPLTAPNLQTTADLRDYDAQVQDAARQVADQTAMLYADHPDARFYPVNEIMDIERRTMSMIPPGWKPFVYPATQPPAQYPDYRTERQIELGRPASMPRLLVRMDASKHSWASARLDMTTYRRSVKGFQAWLSGSEKSTGVLNRLVDAVEAEARFRGVELSTRPESVRYHWTWPQVDDVEPEKTASANQIALTSHQTTLIDVLMQQSNTTLRAFLDKQVKIRDEYEARGLPIPSFLQESIGAGEMALAEATTSPDTDNVNEDADE